MLFSFKFNQSDTERALRAGSCMQLTKTKDRSSLGDDNFKNLVRVAHNGPLTHEVDAEAFVDQWHKDDHYPALCKDSDSGSRVLDRLRAQHKHTFFH